LGKVYVSAKGRESDRMSGDSARPIRVFSTCPMSTAVDRAQYLPRVLDVARWSDEAGCDGILIYTDNSLVDPWLLAQVILQNTERLHPLVAVQPLYMHPYTVAKVVTTFANLYGRRIFLNMVAGGFTNDLLALGDKTSHDRRYDRLVEATTIIQDLLSGDDPVTFSGEFYRVKNLRLNPPLPPALYPGFTVSGSSVAGLRAAKALGATAVQYPKPAGEYEGGHAGSAEDIGLRVGIIARSDTAKAWNTAWDRFPGDRRGQLTHQLAMKTSDSVWHRQLSQLGLEVNDQENPYWLHPFENYRTFCPYLVGSYEEVAGEVAHYIAKGFTTFILDIPPSLSELEHTNIVFEQATQMAAQIAGQMAAG
jgi:alkanesulfonate monooxygenase